LYFLCPLCYFSCITNHPAATMEQFYDKKITFFRFEDLRVYHKALEYITWVHNAISNHARLMAGNLTDSFFNSSKLIALNIAEGSARNKSQFVYYLKLVKSSLRECMVYTTALNNMNLLDDYLEEESRTQLMEMTKMIGALMASLQKNDVNHHHNEED